jgi:hypothetical protein
LKQINNYLERNNYRKRQTKLLHGSGKWKCRKREEKYDEKDTFKDVPLHGIINQIENEIV